jgi:hypothetical protein
MEVFLRFLVVIAFRLAVRAVMTVWGWFIGVRMRRRMRKALNRKVTRAELSSIVTWMEIDGREQTN